MPAGAVVGTVCGEGPCCLYYVVSDDGIVVSDNKHSYGGYKPFYRTITATFVSENEFRGI